MLCDDIIADKELPLSYDGLEPVWDKVRAAQKFVLSPEFALAADGLVDNLDELVKILPYCRLPYPMTWIEWVHDDRPHWDPEGPHKARPVDPNRHQHAPLRCGFLMQQQDKASKFTAHLFWKMKDKPEVGSQYNGSLAAIMFDSEDDTSDPDRLVSANRRIPAEFGFGLMVDLITKQRWLADQLMEYAVEDWGGEIRFMIAVLGLMNARNVAKHDKVDNEQANKKRAKNNKRPLFSHTLVKIRPEIYAHDKAASSVGGQKDIRLHFVRGHFKHRKTGLFWWSMHARGSGKHGIVEKDYEVDA